MSSILQVRGAAKAFGAKDVFTNASFTINEGEHCAVIGPNGAGKTTLFKAIIGIDPFDAGDIMRSRGLRLGYLPQHDEWQEGETIEQFLERKATTPLWELKRLGVGLGLKEEDFERAVQTFSGGYRMRVKLLALLGQEPTLMLLDEPTNYLDLETLVVLEDFLLSYKGAFLLISHDREFLRRTTDHVLEVEAGEVTTYPGSLDDYFEQKAMLRSQLESRAMSVEQKRKEILDFVAKFGAKATKARQAQSRLKSLDRLEKIEIKSIPVTARIRLPVPERVGKLVLKIEKGELGYKDKTVLNHVSLTINGGDHIAVVGFNGAGKSTFLKTLAGELPLIKGTTEHGYQITTAYYAQHVGERLNPDHTVVQAMAAEAVRGVLPQDVLDLAGSLLFSGEDAKKKVRVLSGGEKARVALGQILLKRTSCLILDEPTNHLDFQTVEALSSALHEYPGTVIVVSHDRAFVRKVGTRILEIRDGGCHLYEGTYDDYVWRVQKRMLSPDAQTPKKHKPAVQNTVRAAVQNTEIAAEVAAPQSHTDREQRKALQKEQRSLERKLQELEKKVEEKTAEIERLNALVCASVDGAYKHMKEFNAAQVALHVVEEEWVAAADRLSVVNKQCAEIFNT